MANNAQMAVAFILRAQDRASGAVKTLKSNFESLRNRAAFTSRALGMHHVAAGVRGLGDSYNALTPALGRVFVNANRLIGPLTAITGGGVIVGTGTLISRTAEYADQLDKLSPRLGLTVQRLQELQFAGAREGAQREEVNNAIRSFAKNLGEAVNGTGEALSLFKALNIPLKDNAGRVRDLDEVLYDVADRMQAIQDPAVRVAVAQKLMEEGGVRLVNALSKGRKGLEEYGKEAQKLGLITEEDADLAAALADAQENLSRSFTGLGGVLLRQVLPSVTPLFQWLTATISANRELIGQRVGEVFKAVADAVKAVDWPGVASDIGSIVTGVVELVQWMGGWKVAIAVVAGVMHADLLLALGKLSIALAQTGLAVGVVAAKMALLAVSGAVSSVFAFWQAMAFGLPILSALKIALLANPLGLFLLAVAGAAALVMKFWDPIVSFFDGLDFLKPVRKRLADFLGGLPGFVRAGLGFTDQFLAGLAGQEKTGAPSAVARRSKEAPAAGAGEASALQARLDQLAAQGSARQGGGVSLPVARPGGSAPAPVPVEVNVKFDNVPAGTRVDRVRGGGEGVTVSTQLNYGSGRAGT